MQYNKENPFLAAIKERYLLTHPETEKRTRHIVLDISGSGICYTVGDTLGVFPVHDSELVLKTLAVLGASGSETVVDQRTGQSMPFQEFLSHRSNITEPSRKFISELASRQTDLSKKNQLLELLKAEKRESLRKYLEERDLWEILLNHKEAYFTPHEFIELTMPLLPRFYSIASSPLKTPQEVHLTVAEVAYQPGNQLRYGVCSHYLCNLVNQTDSSIPIYLQPHRGFTLPTDPAASIIMIGPGTGVAPFRGFMQERIASGSSGKNWLFFGGRRRSSDFFYEEEWKEYIRLGKLRLDTAFSRDQTEKIYVQHRMLERGKKLFSWLEEGAYVYVCGDAKKMAKDVEATLLAIIREQGNITEEDAKNYIKVLRRQKRYLRDVY